MVLKSFLDLSSPPIPYIGAIALISANSIGVNITASAKGIGTAPTITPAVVDAPTTL